MNTLDEWVERVRAEFDLAPVEYDRDTVLEVAKHAAHGVARPAAPLTAYLLGVAVGRGHSLADAAARLETLTKEP